VLGVSPEQAKGIARSALPSSLAISLLLYLPFFLSLSVHISPLLSVFSLALVRGGAWPRSQVCQQTVVAFVDSRP